MAVTSGSCYSSYAKNTRFRVDWERTGTWSDNSGCGSIIKWRLMLENGNYWYSNAIQCYAIKINGVTVSNGGTWSDYESSGTYTLIDWQTGVRISHSNDGSEKTFNINYTGWFYSDYNVSASTNFTLPSIPRKTSITSFTVSKVSETTLKFNWQTADTIDYAWYSTNNGSTWTGINVTDGTSGNFNVGNLSPGQSYNCKIKVRRKDSQLESDPSPTVTQSTYAAPTQSLVSKTETSITMKWTLDTTADYIEYTTNGTASSPTWVAVGSVNAKTGQYTISGLTANTPYNIKTRVRRKSSQTKYATSNLAVSTYNYPYVKSVSSNPLTIGNAQTLTVYNPLGRTATVYMKKTNTSGTTLYSGTTSTKGESATVKFTPTASTLYASIPSAQSATCVYYCTYSSQTVGTKSGTYKVKGTETPTFTNFTYKDNNNTIATITGNNQVLVQGLSNLRVTIPSANKMVAKNSASGNKYTVSCDTRNGNVNYSANSDVYVNLGTITTSGSKAISVSAYDSRNLYTTVIKNVTVIPYAKPTIVSSAKRLNNFENQTTLKVNGVFSKVTVDEVDKNTITNVKYRVREVGKEWGSLTAITFTTNDNKYTCSNVTLDLDNTKSFEIQVQTTDTMGQVTTSSVIVNIGIPSFFIKKTGGFESYGDSVVDGKISATSISSSTKLDDIEGSELLELTHNFGCIEDGYWNSTSLDLDDLEVGHTVYYNGSNKPINAPTGISCRVWCVNSYGGEKWQVALVYSVNTLYTRVYRSGAWGNWKFARMQSEVYTTSEQRVGTWIDGKPLYRKVLDLGNLPNTASKDTAHGISHLATFVKLQGVAISTNSTIPLPYATPDGISYAIQLTRTTSYIRVKTGTDRSAYQGYAIMEYTKTTD